MNSQANHVDFQEGLARLAGNKLLYYSLLQMFIDEHENSIQQIKQLLNAGDIKNVKLKIHTISGAAANLGAISLSNTATQFENQSINQIILDPLSHEINYFIAEIKFLLN